jgi:tetratricopeptide (TPR) repeat protein
MINENITIHLPQERPELNISEETESETETEIESESDSEYESNSLDNLLIKKGYEPTQDDIIDSSLNNNISEESAKINDYYNCLNHEIGNVEYQNKNYENAINTYMKIKNYSKIDIIKSNITACYLYLENYEKALHFGLLSIELNIKNSTSWGRIGSAYKGLNKKSEAYTAYKIANKLDPSNIYYTKELDYYRQNLKINAKDIFNLILNNKNLLDKIKINYNTIASNALSPAKLFTCKNVIDIIDDIIFKLEL